MVIVVNETRKSIIQIIIPIWNDAHFKPISNGCEISIKRIINLQLIFEAR